MAGYPFKLSGGNNSNYGAVTARLQLGYQREQAPWSPYLSVAVSGMELPLNNREIEGLALPVLNTSFSIGLNSRIMYNEERRSVWTVGGGIGLSMFRPDADRLRFEDQDTYLSYEQQMDKAWFPEAELGTKWFIHPKTGLGFYCGAHVLATVLWMRDTKTRYTTNIAGTQYNLNFRDVVLWPAMGVVLGWSF